MGKPAGEPVMETKEAPFTKIDQAMAMAVADKVFPGAVLLWGVQGRIMFHRAFGTVDLNTGIPVETGDFFDLASLTKPLATTLAMAELIRTKKVDLSTPLSEVLRKTRGTIKELITIDMLLRHTSGLPAHREFYKTILNATSAPRNVLRQLILAEPLDAEPGKNEVYSDLGYMLLAWVVEKCSGQRLDQFVYDRIYAPLGIDGLFFIDLETGQPSRNPVSDGHAHNHQPRQAIVPTSRCPWRGKLIKGEVEDENAWAAGGIEGHAGLFGDALSVHRLCCEIMGAIRDEGPRVLDPGVMQAFLRRVSGKDRVAGFDTPSDENSSAGKLFSRAGVGHLGFTGTSLWMDPETGLIVILLTNRVHPSRENNKIRAFRPLIHDLISSEFNTNIQM